MIGQALFSKMLLLLLAGSLPFSSDEETSQEVKERETEDMIINSYIYGYPLVTMDVARRVMTNVSTPEGFKAPMGQFANQKNFLTASSQESTAPNCVMLYSGAWLDLSREPYILSLPAMNDRYFFISLLSGWTNVFTSLGSRTTGGASQTFAITGPGWQGILPSGVKEIQAPTNLVWINAQIYCSGSPEDYEAVNDLQDRFLAVPLSKLGRSLVLYRERIDPSIDISTPIVNQVNSIVGLNFFKALALLLKDNPPVAADANLVEMMGRFGVKAGGQVDNSTIELKVVQAMDKAPPFAQERIVVQTQEMGKKVNGWNVLTDAGRYGTLYLTRAAIASLFLGTALSDDVIFPYTSEDGDGNELDGTYNYVLHFASGNLPPAKAFWSLSLYDEHLYFVDNSLNRYSLSSRNGLKFNKDGSLDIYLQNSSPGAEKEANWLPTPKDKFMLMLRLYWPEKAVLDGSWTTPPVEKQKRWIF